jgi:hypothetical protein
LTNTRQPFLYNSWVNFLNSVGIRSFGADTDPSINYYTLTNSFQTYYQSSLSTPYSANNYRLEASCNVSNNSAGTATVLTLRATLTDAYTDPGAPAPGDSVDGTLTISVEELKAAGTLFPSGTFSIVGPSYSLSSITANFIDPTPPPPEDPPPSPPPAFTTTLSPAGDSETVSYGGTFAAGDSFSTTFTLTCTSGSGTVNMAAIPFAGFASASVSPTSLSLSNGQSQTITLTGSVGPGSITNPWTWTATSSAGGSYIYTINRV